MMLGILALLVFGPEGLPGIIKTAMRTVRSLRAAANDIKSEVRTALDDELLNPNQPQRGRKAPARLIDPAIRDSQASGELVSELQDSKAQTASETDKDEPITEKSGPVALATENSTEAPLEQPSPQQEEPSSSDKQEVASLPERAETSSSSPENQEAAPAEDLDPDDGPGIPMTPKRKIENT